MANAEQSQRLLDTCSQILELKNHRGKYYERSEWGAMSFVQIKPQLESVFWSVEELMSLPEEHILIAPGNIVDSVVTRLNGIVENLQQIDNFTISQDNAPTIHNQLTDSLRSNAEKLLGLLTPWIPFLAMRGQEGGRLLEEMRKANTRVNQVLEETNEYVDSTRRKIDSALRAAREESSRAGASQFTMQFRDEADNARIRSFLWLAPTGVFAVAALVLSLIFMLGLFVGTPESALELAYGIGGRVIGISVLFYAAIWSGRIALANMHLTSVNRHRAISLETLQAFQHAVGDPAARDAVVLEAARAVYENVPSGYIGRQAGEHSGGGRILELIRSTRPQAGQQAAATPPQQ